VHRLGDAPQEVGARLVVGERRVGGTHDVLARRRALLGESSPALALRTLVEEEPERRPPEPPFGAAAALELAALPPRGEEGLLQEVLGVGRVPREAPEEAVQSFAVRMEEGG